MNTSALQQFNQSREMVVTHGDEFLNNTAGREASLENRLDHRMPSTQNLVQMNSEAYNNINMAKI